MHERDGLHFDTAFGGAEPVRGGALSRYVIDKTTEVKCLEKFYF